MPIRFYCPFCRQLLGISSRKVGSVVECPSCRGKVGVPGEGVVAPPPVPIVAVPAADVQFVLTPAHLLGLAVVLILLAGFAFIAGMLVGALS
jgi:hypothetical protein